MEEEKGNEREEREKREREEREKREREEVNFTETQIQFLKKLVEEEVNKRLNALKPSMFSNKEEMRELIQENEENILKAIEKEDWLSLNVGGKVFRTSRSTLSKVPQSLLFKMFSNNSNFKWEQQKDSNGAFLLDHDPLYFEPILNFLRYDKVIIDKDVDPMGVYCVAKQFNMIPVVNSMIENGMISQKKKEPFKKVMIVASRLASWIGLSGSVDTSIAQKYNFKKTRKYGNQWELFSHSHELVAMILNDLTTVGWNCITSAAGGANEVSVYHSFILTRDFASRSDDSDHPSSSTSLTTQSIPGISIEND